MSVRIIDASTTEPLRNVHKTSEGYLVADAFTVRTGTQVYRGKELGRPDLDLVTVYRPPEEVFKKDSVSTFAHKPVTIGHPTELVDIANWGQHAVGEVSTEALRDGERLKLQLIVKDQAAIEGIESGKCRQLSAGYMADILWEDGVTPDGTKYQAKQTNIRVNHVALVPRGRAGNCQIGDADWGVVALSDEEATKQQKEVHVATKTIMLGDKAVEVVDTHAQTLLDHVANLERQLGVKDAELTEARGKIMTDADFAAAVDRRVKLVDSAKAKAPTADLSKCVTDGDIMRAVVKTAMPSLVLDGKSDGYVEGIFDTISAAGGQQTADPMRAALRDYQPGFANLNHLNVDEAIKLEDSSWQKSVASINEGL